MNTLTEHKRPIPKYDVPAGFLPATGWRWDGSDRTERIYRKAGSGWTRTAICERRAGEWRWRVEAHRGTETVVEARGASGYLFAEMAWPFADLAARTRR